MVKRFLFPRVEAWVNGLEPEYRTRGFVQSALGLLRIVGLPTDFSGLIAKKRVSERDAMEVEQQRIASHRKKWQAHDNRENELHELGKLL